MAENLYNPPQSDVSSSAQAGTKLSLAQIYFSLEGRVNRKTYWLLYFVPFTTLYAVVIFMMFNDPELVWLELAYIVLVFWPSIAVQGKRWHDRDKSAWWILIGIIPIIGFIWALIENGFLAGNSGRNSYGEPQNF